MQNVKKRNVPFDVLFTRDEGALSEFLDKDIKRFSLSRQYRFSLISLFKLLKILLRYDIIHVHLRHNFFYIKIVLFFFPLKKWKIIFHDHHGDIEFDQSVSIFFKIFNIKYSYIGVSKTLTNWAIENLTNINNIYTLSNIRLINDYKKNLSFSNLKNRSTKKLKIVHVSNIRRTKNIEYAIKLVDELRKNIKVDLTIYGQISDQTYFDELNNIISQNNLKNNISFIHDELNIVSILDDYDFGIYTSKSESGPLVLIEYLSSGIPFISFKTGEVVNMIIDDLPLFIIDNFDLEKWVERINAIMDKDYSPNYLYEIYDKHFSEKVYSDKLISIYNNLYE